MKRRTVIVSLVIAAGLSLSACASSTGQAQGPASTTPSSSANTSPGSNTAPVGDLPKVGDCFMQAGLSSATSVAPLVDCHKTHTEQTVAVLQDVSPALPYSEVNQLRTELGRLAADDPKREEIEQKLAAQNESLLPAAKKCSAAVHKAVGVDSLRYTIFQVDQTGPNKAQWDAGQRWVRCNVFARLENEGEHMIVLPWMLKGAGNEYMWQSCYIRNEKREKVFDFCNSRPFAKEGAWLILTTMLELTGPWPGSEKKADNILTKRCADFAAPYLSTDVKGSDIEYLWGVNIMGVKKELSVQEIWESGEGKLRCLIPNWAFNDAA